MKSSRSFLDNFVEAYKLERDLTVEISHKRLGGRSSLHKNVKVYIIRNGKGNLSVAFDDLESNFYAVLHEEGEKIDLVFFTSLHNPENEEAYQRNKNLARYSVEKEFCHHCQADESVQRISVDCDDYRITFHVTVESVSENLTKFRRLCGRLSDLYHELDNYFVDALFIIKGTGKSFLLKNLSDNGLRGNMREMRFVNYSNQEADDDESFFQRVTIYAYGVDLFKRKEQGGLYGLVITVFPQNNSMDAVDIERYKFVAERVEVERCNSGVSIMLEGDDYCLTMKIHFDRPLLSHESHIGFRFIR